MLTIARLTKYSIKYYNDTADAPKQAAMDRQQANGGLAEYYSEGETRIPTWLVVGDKQLISHATGLTDAELEGGDANTDDVRIWLDDGQSPNGKASREFTDNSVHGFDLTFAAPKSVSLIRALTDDIAEKVLATAHTRLGDDDGNLARLHSQQLDLSNTHRVCDLRNRSGAHTRRRCHPGCAGS